MLMYLRPGNLFKEFLVKRKESDISDIGLPVSGYKDTGILVNGVLAEASTDDREKTKHMWDQDQHSLTHAIVSWAEKEEKKGDVLSLGNWYFLVRAMGDTGSLGVATIYYAGERNDVRGHQEGRQKRSTKLFARR